MDYNNAQKPYQPQQQPYQPAQQPQQPQQQPVYRQPVYQQPVNIESTLPPQYRPLSAWAYFGYSLLLGIPIVGFILAIVFSFNNNNINRRNFFRSFFCGLLIAAIIFVVLLVIALITGAGIYGMFDF